MNHSPVSSSDAKKKHQDECCDLYGEYCYPCTIDVAAATPKGGAEKVGERNKRGS